MRIISNNDIHSLQTKGEPSFDDEINPYTSIMQKTNSKNPNISDDNINTMHISNNKTTTTVTTRVITTKTIMITKTMKKLVYPTPTRFSYPLVVVLVTIIITCTLISSLVSPILIVNRLKLLNIITTKSDPMSVRI
jgi:hypothetical protein